MSTSLFSDSIVIDNGSYSIRCGFSGTFKPDFVVPSKVATYDLGKNTIQTYCADGLARAPDDSVMKPIFSDGPNTINWDALESVYKHLLHQRIQVSSSQENLNFLLVNKPFMTNKNKELMTEMMLEKFEAGGVYFGHSVTMGLYANGVTTGVVLESGYKHTIAAPIYEGALLPLNMQCAGYGGYHVDEYLKDSLEERNHTEIKADIVSNIKEKHCLVAMDYFDEMSSRDVAAPIEYRLPDGSTVEIGKEKFKAPELLFQPKSMSDGMIHEEGMCAILNTAISRCGSKDLKKAMYDNVVIIGGNTLLPGVKKRVYKGLTHLAPASAEITLKSSPQREYATFTGASILADQERMKQVWITKTVIQEYGYKAITLRCF